MSKSRKKIKEKDEKNRTMAEKEEGKNWVRSIDSGLENCEKKEGKKR